MSAGAGGSEATHGSAGVDGVRRPSHELTSRRRDLHDEVVAGGRGVELEGGRERAAGGESGPTTRRSSTRRAAAARSGRAACSAVTATPSSTVVPRVRSPIAASRLAWHGGSDALDRVPVLREHLRLAGREPAEVGLVVGVDTGHQLDVRAVVVGQLRIPGVAERARRPTSTASCPGRCALGPVHETGAGGVVVAAEEVVLRVDDHVGGRHGDVAVEVDAVGAGPVRAPAPGSRRRSTGGRRAGTR